MSPPTAFQSFRQVIGRALRESGQALDRLGIMGIQHANTTRLIGDDPYYFDDHLSRHRHLMPLIERGAPLVSPEAAFLAPCSTLIGSVRVAAGASIWYGAVLRADSCENGSSLGVADEETEATNEWELHPDRMATYRFTGRAIGGGIFIGPDSNVQDACIITSRVSHTVLGKGVTVGHAAQIHSATVQEYALIGMGCIVQSGVVVEKEAMVAAGAVVAQDTVVGEGELWVGSPARKLRDLTPAERKKLHYQANEYVKVATSQQSVMELGGNVPESISAEARRLLTSAGSSNKKDAAVDENAQANSASTGTNETQQATTTADEKDRPTQAATAAGKIA